MIRKLFMAAAMFGALFVAACDTERHSDAFTDPTKLPATTQYAIGKMTTKVGIPQDFDYQGMMRRQLEKRLSNEHWLAVANDPNAVQINLTVTEFQRGDLGLRMIPFMFGEREASSIFGVTAELIKDGKTLGTATARKAVNLGGPFSANGERDMVSNCMDLIYDQIEEKTVRKDD